MQYECDISVIIPVYNSASTLKQAIESVLNQEVSLELLVIDDGSRDEMDEVMAAYRDDSRVIYLKNGNNIGVSATRNRGISMAKGKYVAFLDADDRWVDGKLQRQLDILENTNGCLCATGRALMDVDGKLTGRIIPVKETVTYEDMLRQNWINNSSILAKREVLQEFPMETDDVHEDYLLWLKVIKKYGPAYGINEPMLQYRVYTNSKSGNKLRSAIMTYRTYRRAGLGRLQAMRSFVSYAVAGVKKYY